MIIIIIIIARGIILLLLYLFNFYGHRVFWSLALRRDETWI